MDTSPDPNNYPPLWNEQNAIQRLEDDCLRIAFGAVEWRHWATGNQASWTPAAAMNASIARSVLMGTKRIAHSMAQHLNASFATNPTVYAEGVQQFIRTIRATRTSTPMSPFDIALYRQDDFPLEWPYDHPINVAQTFSSLEIAAYGFADALARLLIERDTPKGGALVMVEERRLYEHAARCGVRWVIESLDVWDEAGKHIRLRDAREEFGFRQGRIYREIGLLEQIPAESFMEYAPTAAPPPMEPPARESIRPSEPHIKQPGVKRPIDPYGCYYDNID